MNSMRRHQDQHGSLIGPDTSEAEADDLIRDAIIEDENPISNCCGVPFMEDSDFCAGCKDHASALITGFKFPGNPDTFSITYDPLTQKVSALEKERWV